MHPLVMSAFQRFIWNLFVQGVSRALETGIIRLHHTCYEEDTLFASISLKVAEDTVTQYCFLKYFHYIATVAP
jgi:hypothetical protein